MLNCLGVLSLEYGCLIFNLFNSVDLKVIFIEIEFIYTLCFIARVLYYGG